MENKLLKAVSTKSRLPDKEGFYHIQLYHTNMFNGLDCIELVSDEEDKFELSEDTIKYWKTQIEYWYEEVTKSTLKSREILPLDERIDQKVKWLFNDNEESRFLLKLLQNYHKALEVSEQEVIILNEILTMERVSREMDKAFYLESLTQLEKMTKHE